MSVGLCNQLPSYFSLLTSSMFFASWQSSTFNDIPSVFSPLLTVRDLVESKGFKKVNVKLKSYICRNVIFGKQNSTHSLGDTESYFSWFILLLLWLLYTNRILNISVLLQLVCSLLQLHLYFREVTFVTSILQLK